MKRLFGLWLAGCASTTQVATVHVPAPEVEPSNAPPAWIEAGRVIAHGRTFLVERSGLTIALAGRDALEGCGTFAVRAEAGLRDVDVRLYDAAGRQLVVDDAPDAHAWVELCDGVAAFARVDAHAGAGELTWVWARGQVGAISTELGTAGGRRSVDGWRVLDETLVARGFGLRHERWSSVVDSAVPLEAPLRLEAGRCLTVAARAEVGPLTLAVQERRVADVTDAIPGAIALQLCSGREVLEGTLEIGVSTATRVEVARWEGPEAEVGGDEALWLGVVSDR
ncbi:MAG: hypothetical protein R3B99_33325 [Polyangiales bacterium]